MTSPYSPTSQVFGSEIRTRCKAIYYPNPITGEMRLARIHEFDKPIYNPASLTAAKVSKRNNKFSFVEPEDDTEDDTATTADEKNIARAVRRARRNAFDLIMCNPDLDAFVTLTYAPENVEDKAAYDACYPYLRTWLSNGVQRDGLKYVCIPELTKRGDIHFHAICNAGALRLARARHARSGRALSRHGDPIFNLTNWHAGFSTAQVIRQRHEGDDCRAAVAKYMFKYMTKNFGAKIGGRYMLHGGALATPHIEFADSAADLVGQECLERAGVFSKEIGEGENARRYTEYDFLHGQILEVNT